MIAKGDKNHLSININLTNYYSYKCFKNKKIWLFKANSFIYSLNNLFVEGAVIIVS